MLAQAYRLRKATEFQRLYSRGNRKSSNNLRIFWRPTTFAHPNISVVVSKKITKKATARNKMRRRVYEIIRQQLGSFKGSFNMIILLKNDITHVEPKVLEAELIGLLKRSYIL